MTLARAEQHLHCVADQRSVIDLRVSRLSVPGNAPWAMAEHSSSRAHVPRSLSIDDDDLHVDARSASQRTRSPSTEDRRLPDVAGRADRRRGPEARGAAGPQERADAAALPPRRRNPSPASAFPSSAMRRSGRRSRLARSCELDRKRHSRAKTSTAIGRSVHDRTSRVDFNDGYQFEGSSLSIEQIPVGIVNALQSDIALIGQRQDAASAHCVRSLTTVTSNQRMLSTHAD